VMVLGGVDTPCAACMFFTTSERKGMCDTEANRKNYH